LLLYNICYGELEISNMTSMLAVKVILLMISLRVEILSYQYTYSDLSGQKSGKCHKFGIFYTQMIITIVESFYGHVVVASNARAFFQSVIC